MPKKIWTLFSVIAGGALIIFVIVTLFTKTAVAGKTVTLYYGDGCPHCEKVEEFIKTSKVENKLNFARKEVFKNQANAAELTARYQTCGLPTENGVGVPLLWDGVKCYTGDTDIINYFASKL